MDIPRPPYAQGAAIYSRFHHLIGKDYMAESEQVRQQIHSRNQAAYTLLDVGCGAGDHLVFLNADFSVAGVDASPVMLELARERLPDVEFHVADMRTLNLGRTYDAVVCLFSSIGYMRSVEELDLAVASMAKHLGPSGVLLVDGWVSPTAWEPGGEVRHEYVEDDEGSISRVSKMWRDGQMVILEMHYRAAGNAIEESFAERHEVTLFSEAQYRAAFEKSGLSVDLVPSPVPSRDRYIGIKPVDRAGLGR